VLSCGFLSLSLLFQLFLLTPMLKIGYSFRFIHNLNNSLNQLFLPLSALSGIYESGNRAVEGLLYFWRKDTGGEFFELEVVGDALAALALSGAGFVGAGAVGFIGFKVTFHLI